jgi:hypothetical protein
MINTIIMKKLNQIALVVGCSLLLTACIKEYQNPAVGKVSDRTDIYYVRLAHSGNNVTLNEQHLSGARFTSGVVISDKTAGNTEPGTFVMQATTTSSSNAGDIVSGIVVDMGAGADVPSLGDSVRVDVIGANLQRRNGQLVLSGINSSRISVLETNRNVIPTNVSLGMLNSNFSIYESTLIAVHADVMDHTASLAYNGEVRLNDNTGTGLLDTRSTAAFASNIAPKNAQFMGIASYKNTNGNDTTGAKRIISLRNSNDIKFVSGVLYAAFPETFEAPDATSKSSYNITATANNIDLATGNWKLQQAILGNIILSDKMVFPGKQSVRFQQNLSSSGLAQMNFDVTEGASKVTVFFGRYASDPRSSFRLEYSLNGGSTWVILTPTISDLPDRGLRQATWIVNLSGNVRFRINKLGLGTTTATVQNGRLNIDDMAIYKKL